MAGLKEIKQKIRSTVRTRTVTKAMEAVSAAKMRKSQHKAIGGRAYARAASSILARVSATRELSMHPLAKMHESGVPLYIVITSDKGLAGALNSAVLRAVDKELSAGAQIIAIGRKANDYLSKRGHSIVQYYPNTDTISVDTIDDIVSVSAKKFVSGEVRHVRIAYQNFISTFEQRPTRRTIFPLSLEELNLVVSDILPARGALAQAPVQESAVANYTVEPSESDVLGAVIPKLAGIFVYHALLESQASEHSARMVAMKGASDKAGEMQHSLQLKFNKARQAAITREVSEITGGMEAMAS